MKQSVYVVTALFAGITIGVFAAELSNMPTAAIAPRSGPSNLETAPPAKSEDLAQGKSATLVANTAVDAEALATLLEAVEQAALERQALAARHEALHVRIRRLEEDLAVATDEGNSVPSRARAAAELNTDPPTAAPVAADRDELQALMAAGFDAYEAADIRRRAGEAEMERLYLRDRAMREGWFGSERYREELEALENPGGSLRSQWGDQAFDRYLYAIGENNRIRIDSIITASPAEAAGLMAGDLIYRYANQRIFSTADLRSAIADGSAGETVSVEVSRDGARRSFYVGRGPLGVRLRTARVEP